MKSTFTACAALWLVLGAPLAALAAPAAPVDGWPDTRTGQVGRRYVAAFTAGDAAMRAFYEKEMSAGSLAKKPAGERLSNYRKLRERFGALTFGAVVKSTPLELTVTLLDADAAPHEFIFTVEPGPARRLISIAMRENRPGGHGGLGSFFHH